MKRALKIGVAIIVAAIAAAAALIYPYKIPGIPEWRIQILDSRGKPLVAVPVNEDWLDPMDEGNSSGDQRKTDGTGTVVFPKRALRNRLALGSWRTKREARILVCTNDEYGALYWDGSGASPATLTLQQGACPYD